MSPDLMEIVIFWCGVAHFGLCLGSLFIPRALNWKMHLSTLPVLMRQMFWTYAGYILGINLTFGVISVFGAGELLHHTFLARAVTLLIGIYWLTRLAVQFFYFDRSMAPKGFFFLVGEIFLIGLFLVFAVSYLASFLINIQWL
jgi:hypothetical protein